MDEGMVVRNGTNVGVLQSVDRTALVELATQRDAHVELLVEVGEYVGVATPIARIHGDPELRVTGDDVAGMLPHRWRAHPDPRPGFRLSPTRGYSHPRPLTGSQRSNDRRAGVDRIVDLLATVAARPDPSGWFVDEAGTARVHCREPSIGRLVDLASSRSSATAQTVPQVVRRLRAAFDVLAGVMSAEVVVTIDALRRVLDQTQGELMPAAFAEISTQSDRHGLG